MFILIAMILWKAEPMLIAFGQDPVVSRLTAKYVHLMLPGLFFNGMYNANTIFLNAFEITAVSTVASMISLPTHCLIGWIFVYKLDMGLQGVAISMFIINFSCFLGLALYCSYLRKIREAWFAPDIDTFRQLGEYLGLGLPGVLMIGVEWIVYEILAIFAGWIGIEELSAMSLTLNFGTLLYGASSALALSLTIFVGNAIGDKNAALAKRYRNVGISFGVLMGLAVAVFMCVARNYIPLVFTNDDGVNRIFATCLVYYAVVFPFDAVQNELTGVIRGIGKQRPATIANLFCFLVLSLPGSYLFGVTLKLDLMGLFLGLGIAVVILCAGYAFVIVHEDWDKIALRVNTKMAKN